MLLAHLLLRYYLPLPFFSLASALQHHCQKNKPVNKKSRAVCVSPHYRPLIYASAVVLVTTSNRSSDLSLCHIDFRGNEKSEDGFWHVWTLLAIFKITTKKKSLVLKTCRDPDPKAQYVIPEMYEHQFDKTELQKMTHWVVRL